jgi:dienelactone hydrolase
MLRAVVVPALVVVLVSTGMLAQTPAADTEISSARAFIGLLAAEDFSAAAARFDPTMKAALPADRLATTWARVLAQAGPYVSIVSARKETRGPYQVVSTTCRFQNLNLDIVTTFNAAGEIAGLSFPPQSIQRTKTATPSAWPSYANAGSFAESDITIGAGTEWPLPGTLTMPNGAGPFPAVVLVHGSGPGDRDETVGPNKPFRDLAAGLASRGIAVVRYDKRSRTHGPKVAALPRLTVKDEVIDDVVSAVAVARSLPRVAMSRVFVLGHSLGGALVPRIASATPDVRGFVVMAGATRPIEQALVEQARYLAILDGRIAPDEQDVIDALLKAADTIRALTSADAEGGVRVLNVPASYWLDLRGYQPPIAAQSVGRPLLVLQGERDYQVTTNEFAAWRTALAAAPQATFRSYQSLNHLFMTGSGPSGPDEYLQPGHVAEPVVEDIAGWIKEH